jgi:hypothetical protein
MKVIRLLALLTSHLYPQKMFLVLIIVRDWVNSGARVGRKDYVNEKYSLHYRESTLQSSGL